MINVNTVSHNKTHFLAGVQLVREGNSKFSLPSENWPYPTEFYCGEPWFDYYAEIWSDGMDWNINYWLLEQSTIHDPVVLPLLHFENHSERDKFNQYDFSFFAKHLLLRRRELVVPRKEMSHSIDSDEIVPFLKSQGRQSKNGLALYSFEHNSQELVNFWVNDSILIPLPVRKEKLG